MKKSLSIFKYEFTNLKRDKIFWVSIILYFFGYQQVFSAFVRNMKLMGGLISLIRLSWLPINLVMIPLLIIASDIGANRDEIFDIMDIRPVEKTAGKALAIMALAGIFLFINMLITTIMALVSKVSLPYFWYLMKGHLSNMVLSLLVVTLVGLFVGELLGHILSGIISFLVIVVFFILTCTFYKTDASILTLYNITVTGSNFNLFRYDQYFTYHKLLWISVAIAAALGAYMIEHRQSYRKTPIVQMSMIIVLVVIAIFSTVNGGKYKPVFYQVIPGASSVDSSPYHTYIPSQTPGYKVENYDMNIDLSRNFKNQCSMRITVTEDGVSNLTFGLYGKLKIENVYLNDKEVDFTRDNEKFTVKLPGEAKKDQSFTLSVNYSGIINTVWAQGTTLFFTDNKSSFLAEAFAWYPKLNDNLDKSYTIKLKHNNQIFSNLDIKKEDTYYSLNGSDKEIFLLSGEIAEKDYKGYRLIGNQEYFKSDNQCEQAIARANKYSKDNDFNTIIYTPFIPSKGKVSTYKGVYMDNQSDTSEIITTK